MLIGCLNQFPLNSIVTFTGCGQFKIIGFEDSKVLLQYIFNPLCIVRQDPERLAINCTLKI